LVLPILALALSIGSTTTSLEFAFNVTTNAPPNDGYFLMRNPLVPTDDETFKINFSGSGVGGGVTGAGVDDGAGAGGSTDDELVGVVDSGAGAGASLPGPGAGSVEEAGVAAVTFSKNHAAV
jgi:hypothetical protein